ncbi:MAG: hypothetical protein A3F83_07100 [Candidatus Glassbacteria bacterium RIFCSPLOWO2_12_FULL_58_11]|uniref:Acetyltransferase n=2 Tax=Candidatus Glassiibacteriota TaxID=1817805 RepID=A0A1F5YSJ3_9BACT|nr:MAG: hypothetical protein A2Z86_02550 [Candidatus Glassbacteria bacterium GWA2_58_10]OGG03066.1 MAG: hypothetical protein A3F83_07100 [Candidatus Glassbacteria bacterium RIFCSPLOWO2_12_FULL_58_11]
MSQALKEIGLKKSFKYILGLFQLTVLKIVLLPPNVRRMLLNLYGADVGIETLIHPITFINIYRRGFKGLACGRYCFVGEECLLDLADGIELGDNVTLAPRVTILTHINVGYKHHPLQEYFPASSSPVEIGSGSFVGANSTILPGVKIGENALVASGSLVKENVREWTVVGGVPARLIREIERVKK